MIYNGTEKSWTDICAENSSRDLLIQLPLILLPKPIELSTADMRIFPDTLPTDDGHASLLACHYDHKFRDEKFMLTLISMKHYYVLMTNSPPSKEAGKCVVLTRWQIRTLRFKPSFIYADLQRASSRKHCTLHFSTSRIILRCYLWLLKKWHSSTCQYFPLIIDFCPSLHFLSFPPACFVRH